MKTQRDPEEVALDRLRKLLSTSVGLRAFAIRGRGNPSPGNDNHAQWAKDVAKYNGDTKKLSKHWGIKPRAVRNRKRHFSREVPLGVKTFCSKPFHMPNEQKT